MSVMTKAPRGRPPQVVRDATPLGARQIDVGARVGWALQVARLTAPEGLVTQSEMLRRLRHEGLVIGSLTPLESGRRRSGAVVDAYERVLGLPVGSLRSPVDELCRSHPGAPEDSDPGTPRLSHEAVSAAVEGVLTPPATGGDWLALARLLAQPGALGFPDRYLRPLVDRLVAEIGRGMGASFQTRYEALALLRRSAYGEVVMESAEAYFADRGTQLVSALTTCIIQRSEPGALQWIADRVDDDRTFMIYGLDMAVMSLLDAGTDWAADSTLEVLAERLAWALADAEGRPSRVGVLRDMARRLPEEVWAQMMPDLGSDPAPLAVCWEQDEETNPQWALVAGATRAFESRHALGPQPMLTRLLFEMLYEERELSSYTGLNLLVALPCRSTVVELLVDIADRTTDQAAAASARRMVVRMATGEPLDVAHWIASDDDTTRAYGLVLQAHAGRLVEREQIEWLLSGDELRQHTALYVAGMSQDRFLHELAQDATRPESVRRAARWWIETGGRVVDA